MGEGVVLQPIWVACASEGRIGQAMVVGAAGRSIGAHAQKVAFASLRASPLCEAASWNISCQLLGKPCDW